MKLSLDTHIWVWLRGQTNRLSVPVQNALQDSTNELWLSPLSLWEILNLVDRGRLKLDIPVEYLLDTNSRVSVREATVTREVALATRQLRLDNRDPIGRLLAATAIVYGLTLVTADEYLLAEPGLETLANR